MTRLTFTLFCLLLSTWGFSNEKSEALIKEKEQSVFVILCYNEKNEVISTSTGFFIDRSGIALTNIHVFKEAYRAKIKTSDGKVYDVEKLLDYDPNLDLAKILIKKQGTQTFPSVTLSTKLPEQGEEIFALASEIGQETKVSKGVVSSLNAVANYGVYYQISASIAASGGIPVFNTEGHVIAITAFGTSGQSNVVSKFNYAVNVSNSKNLTKDLNLKLEKSYKEIIYDDFVGSYIMSLLSKDYDNAIKVCDRQIQEKPYAWLAYHYRGMSKMEIKKFAEAEQDIKKALQLNKSNQFKEIEYFALGKIYKRAKMYAQSKEAYMKALELNPKSATCFCELAVLAEEWLGKNNKLVEDSYMKALTMDPRSCAFGYTSIALNSLSQQQFEKAIQYFSLALEIEREKKGLLIGYFNRGNSYYETKRFEEALADFEMCVKLMPDDYESCLSIGMCYLKMGKKAQACAAYQKAKQTVETYKLGPEAKATVQQAIQVHCK